MSAYVPSTPRVLEALRRHGSATMAALAAELNLPVTEVAEDVGGLHDCGLATRYGRNPDSLAVWAGPDNDYVLSCLARVGVPA